MKLNISSVKKNEVSYRVVLIHKVLSVLGFPVAVQEKQARKAGDSTHSQLKNLAAQYGFVLPQNNNLMVDPGTVSSLENVLKQAGLLTANKFFEVSGAVLDSNGKAVKQRALIAFDLDLSGVGVFKTVKTLKALAGNGGFEFLGETKTDGKGHYSIQFYTWLYQRAERSKADIVVYALDGNKIVGRSALVRAQDYDKGVVRDLNITIDIVETISEYRRYFSAAQNFLKESGSSLAAIANSPEQIAFTASELEIDTQHMQLLVETAQFAAANTALIDQKHSHALFYGLARQGSTISWHALFNVHEDELVAQIKRSVADNIIDAPSAQVLKKFLAAVSKGAVDAVVADGDPTNPASLVAVLKYVPFNQKQKRSFAQALRSFKGNDASLFWNEHLLKQPEFKNKPKEIEKLLFTYQVSVMSEQNPSLIKTLQSMQNIKGVDDLIALTPTQWDSLIKKTDIPSSVPGETKKQRQKNYAARVKKNLDDTFPNLRAAQLVRDGDIKVGSAKTAKYINTFLTTNKTFDLNTSKIHDYDDDLKTLAKDEFELVRSELMTLQRLNQISAVPENINVLKSNNLLSSYAINTIPKKAFISQYSNLLGGKENALMVYQKAARNTQAAEMHLMQLSDYASGHTPDAIIPGAVKPEILRLIEERTNGGATNEVNYSRLFGSPDICECEQCQSIYGPAAYYVDILRFVSLSHSVFPNVTALDILLKRRPDLVHLPLNCENTHTLIPYVDLANEVMEAYVVFSLAELSDYQGYDTGTVTAEELRASPQNVRDSAYQILSDDIEGSRAVFPYTLPYHQPLDAIRAYCQQLGISRYDLINAINPEPDQHLKYALTAESLSLSEAEYQILTGRDFDNEVDRTSTYVFYGTNSANKLKELSTDIPELLQRTGLDYTELIELIKTQFLNPHRPLLSFLQRLITKGEISANTLYDNLLHFEELTPSTNDVITGSDIYADLLDISLGSTASNKALRRLIAEFNANHEEQITQAELNEWVRNNLDDFNSIMTLYAPDASCDLANTSLTTMDKLYSPGAVPSVTGGATFWKKLHRFIRLQRQLGLTVIETDTLLTAVGESNITHRTLAKLDAAIELTTLMNIPIAELAVLWGDMQTNVPDSLYKKLFLDNATLPIDPEFEPNIWGEYFKTKLIIADKIPSLLGAYGITESELKSILNVEEFDPNAESLSVLSVIFRYVSVANSMDISVADLITFIHLSGVYPFSKLTVTTAGTSYQDINPEQTLLFIKELIAVKEAGFSISQLAYIIEGVDDSTNPTSSLNQTKVIRSLDTIHAEVKQLSALSTSNEKDARESLLQNTANLLDISLKLTGILIKEKESNITEITTSLIEFINDDAITDDEALPGELVSQYQTLISYLDRATLFIKTLSLNTLNSDKIEVEYFINNSEDFDGLNFEDITFQQFLRMNSYIRLRELTSKKEQSTALIDIFSLANTPGSTLVELLPLLNGLTDVSESDLRYMIENHFSLTDIEKFNNEIVLTRLLKITELIKLTGFSAESVIALGNAETNYGNLNSQSIQLQQAVRSKYSKNEWLTIAAKISDKLRENQQQALVAYLLQKREIKQNGVFDADSLFEYLLIDVQMTSCMETSRVVQASAAVQMFITRALLNLEKQVSPKMIDKDRWQWMKNYRVWEANRKVFLYPENWLEPEWRNNKSEFFSDLESYLTQNDISDKNVEAALRAYVYSVDEVSNLEICGLYKEDLPGENNNENLYKLHVFGRTNAAPYKFYYRTLNKFKKWSAWETVSAGIKSVEDGENSGVHLVPVVWKKRLLLFWPEFIKTQVAPDITTEEFGVGDSIRLQEATEVWEIRLAWSEYVDGSWSSKQVTKEYSEYSHPSNQSLYEEKKLFFFQKITENNELIVTYSISILGLTLEEPIDFIFSSMSSSPSVRRRSNPIFQGRSNYEYFFSNRIYNSSLIVRDDTYLDIAIGITHVILPNCEFFLQPDSDLSVYTHENPDPVFFRDPFFFNANNDTYFVHQTLIPAFFWASPGLPIPRISAGHYEMEFHTFHHPRSGAYIENLNRNGITGLMACDTQHELGDDQGSHFNNQYSPNFDAGLVTPNIRHVRSDGYLADRTYYKENVSFDVLGANSLYNWELFFHAPLYVATRLMKNGKHEEAMKWFHYIFDPTNDKEDETEGGTELARVWQVLPFKKEAKTSLEQWFKDTLSGSASSHPVIDEWRDNPFDPHLVAGNRPLAYMKHVLMKYVENLVAWGDAKFKQFTRENVYEALQLYVIAGHILGPKPQRIPKRGNLKAETFDSLKNKWDAFGNALVELENFFPYSGPISGGEASTGSNILGVGERFYFCIPANEKLITYWETVEDRLFKIRNCQDINGTARRLALFAPPIDPALLVQANSQGLNFDDVLAELNAPAPIYRFPYLIQKANEFCNDVMSLGAAILTAIEKKDAESLSLLRSSQEITLQESITNIREKQILDAQVTIENLEKTRESTIQRLTTYTKRLGIDDFTVPVTPDVTANLSLEDSLPEDTVIDEVSSGAENQPVFTGESNVNIIYQEKRQIELTQKAADDLDKNYIAEQYASYMGLIPQFEGKAQPFGVGAGTGFGGRELGWFAGSIAKAFGHQSQINSTSANKAATLASYIRREQDWALQAQLAAREIIQIDKQITAAKIREQVANKELENHKKQIENAREVEQFLQNKFSGQELYNWMREQLLFIHKQSYDLCYELISQAEQAYSYELGTTPNFLQGGRYWDNNKLGLLAGEKLQLTLRQMESSYIKENKRKYELTKHISLSMLDPLALVRLRTTGVCDFEIPEALYDMDHAGQYFRRIKSVSISVPCITGPYTSVSAKLSLESNKYRKNTHTNNAANTGYIEDIGNDERFNYNIGAIQSIATSSAQNDSGVFELNFRDERYLPFEGTGAISEWSLELPTKVKQFDYNTISDVILHVKYTAREGGSEFKIVAEEALKTSLQKIKQNLSEEGLHVAINMRHDMSTAWHLLKTNGKVDVTIEKSRLPYFIQSLDASIDKVIFIAKLEDVTPPEDMPQEYKLTLKSMIDSNEITLKKNDDLLLYKGDTNTISLDETFEISGDVSKLEELVMVVKYKFT